MMLPLRPHRAATFILLATFLGASGGCDSTTPDVEPPLLLSLSFVPGVVDVSDRDGVIQFMAGLADPGSGVERAQLAIHAPAGHPWADCMEMQRVGGSAANGIWACPVTITASMAPDIWTVARVSVWDRAGNTRNYLEADLRAAGHPVEITVVSTTGEHVPPVLTGLTLMPETVDVSEGDQRVEVFIEATDEGSGVAEAFASIGAPGSSSASGCITYEPSEGTRQIGTFTCGIWIQDDAILGDWKVTTVQLIDVSGNERSYDTAELEAGGFSTTVTVTR